MTIARKLWLGVVALGIALVVILAGAALRAQSMKVDTEQQGGRIDRKTDLAARWVALTETNAARAVASLAAVGAVAAPTR